MCLCRCPDGISIQSIKSAQTTASRLDPCQTEDASCSRGTGFLVTAVSAWCGPSLGCARSWCEKFTRVAKYFAESFPFGSRVFPFVPMPGDTGQEVSRDHVSCPTTIGLNTSTPNASRTRTSSAGTGKVWLVIQFPAAQTWIRPRPGSK